MAPAIQPVADRGVAEDPVGRDDQPERTAGIGVVRKAEAREQVRPADGIAGEVDELRTPPLREQPANDPGARARGPDQHGFHRRP